MSNYTATEEELIFKGSAELKKEVHTEISKEWKATLDEHSSVSRVVLDMENVKFVDSSGISLLVGLYKECKEVRGLDFKMENCSDEVVKLLSVVKLDQYFGI